jgi:hypothetical protein
MGSIDERAGDPLHRAGIDAKALGNAMHTFTGTLVRRAYGMMFGALGRLTTLSEIFAVTWSAMVQTLFGGSPLPRIRAVPPRGSGPSCFG